MIAGWCKIDVSRPVEEKILVVNFLSVWEVVWLDYDRFRDHFNAIVIILDRFQTLSCLLSLLQGPSLTNIKN